MLEFLRDNYQTMTNQQLAYALQLRLTVTRNKLAELGLKRMELEYWTPEQVKYLKQNFRKMADATIASHFEKTWPKKKKWTKKHIRKKRCHLNLHRTDDEVKQILDELLEEGSMLKGLELGRTTSNAAINLTDNHVAGCMSRKRPELRQLLLQHPDLIELKRTSIILERTIRNESAR